MRDFARGMGISTVVLVVVLVARSHRLQPLSAAEATLVRAAAPCWSAADCPDEDPVCYWVCKTVINGCSNEKEVRKGEPEKKVTGLSGVKSIMCVDEFMCVFTVLDGLCIDPGGP